MAFRVGLSQTQYYAMAIQYLSMAIGLCNVLLISKMYGFEAVGTFFFYASVQQIASFAATLGVSSYSTRVLNRTVSQQRVIFLLFQHAVAVMLFGVAVLMVNVAIGFRNNGELALLLAACWFGLIRYFIEDVSAGLGWFVRGSLVALIENIARLLIALLFGISDSRDALIILAISATVATSLTGYKILSFINFNTVRTGSKEYLKIYYRNSIFMFSSHLIGLLQNRMGVLAAPYIVSATEVGIFVLLINISEISLRVGGMVGRYIYVGASSRIKANIFSGPAALVLSVTLIGLAISMVMLSGYPFINSYIYDGSLTGYFIPFFVLSIYSTAFLYFNLSSNFLYGSAAAGVVILSSVIGILVCILLMITAWLFSSFFVLCSAVAIAAVISSLLNGRQLFLRHSIR